MIQLFYAKVIIPVKTIVHAKVTQKYCLLIMLPIMYVRQDTLNQLTRTVWKVEMSKTVNVDQKIAYA